MLSRLPYPAPDAEIVHTSTEDEWLAARRELGITASEAPQALGLLPVTWGATPVSLYLEKIGAREPEDLSAVEVVQIGNDLEPVVVERMFSRDADRQVEPCGTLYRSTRWPWLGATPDYYQWRDGVLGIVQAKCTSVPEPWLSGEAPAHVVCQVQTELAVTGLPFASVAALILGKYFRWVDIERDEERIADIVAQLDAFCARVRDLDPPPLGAADNQTAQAVYPQGDRDPDDDPIVLPGELIELDEQYADAEREKKDATARLSEIQNKFKEALGENPVGVLPNGTVFTWKADVRGNRRFIRRERPVSQ